MSNQRILHCCLLQGSLHAGRRQCPVESQHQIRRAHKRVGLEWDCALRGNIVGMCKPRKGCSEFDDLSLALVAVADVCARPWSAFAVMIGRRGEARSVALIVARLLGERISARQYLHRNFTSAIPSALHPNKSKASSHSPGPSTIASVDFRMS